jgi:riboflavin synthase
MFTGIIKELGTVDAIEWWADGARLRIRSELASELGEGDSVAVNGACLTATTVTGEAFEADVMHQTLELTTLGALAVGSGVNLELPLRADERLGGHIVQGHVDGTATVAELVDEGFAKRVRSRSRA